MAHAGVLITGFGGPDRLEAVGPFMCNLMGRAPADELVARVCARYEAIGGSSPLPAIARELAARLSEELAGRGVAMPVEVGMRYWDPLIADGIARLAAAGVDSIVSVALSPFETHVTHGEYRDAVAEALRARPGTSVIEAPLLSELPSYAPLHAAAAQAALAALADDAPVVFSAHSLPVAEAGADEAYVRGLQRVADAVASRLGLSAGTDGATVLEGITGHGSARGERRWVVAYQSKGTRGGEWLGPDVDDVIAAIRRAGRSGVIVVPIGFATDHMETLYDLDIVAAGMAAEIGIDFARSAVPNAAPALVRDIADAVVALCD